MRRTIVLATLLAVAAAGIWLVTAAAAGGGGDPWQPVKAATARYHSVQQAEKAGYRLDPHCAASPAGVMGFHYENAELMADDAIDPLRPEILVYVPKKNGKLELVALEYWKRDADGNLATSGDRPSLFGVPFDGPMPGHGPVMPVHYDLHVWLFRDNPSGFHAPFNPSLSCTP